MRSLLCKFFIEAAVGKTQGDTSPAFVLVCVSVCAGACLCVCVWVLSSPTEREPSFPFLPRSFPHGAVRLKAYFATCMRVFRTELDRGASSGEVTDCVIVSKLNNQYGSTCWDNTIIHLWHCRGLQAERHLPLLSGFLRCPTLEILCQNCSKRRGCSGAFFHSIHMGDVKHKMIFCKMEGNRKRRRMQQDFILAKSVS